MDWVKIFVGISSQYFYRNILLNHFKPPTKQQERRKEELNTEIVQ
jgi:hypothetical protein